MGRRFALSIGSGSVPRLVPATRPAGTPPPWAVQYGIRPRHFFSKSLRAAARTSRTWSSTTVPFQSIWWDPNSTPSGFDRYVWETPNIASVAGCPQSDESCSMRRSVIPLLHNRQGQIQRRDLRNDGAEGELCPELRQGIEGAGAGSTDGFLGGSGRRKRLRVIYRTAKGTRWRCSACRRLWVARR